MHSSPHLPRMHPRLGQQCGAHALVKAASPGSGSRCRRSPSTIACFAAGAPSTRAFPANHRGGAHARNPSQGSLDCRLHCTGLLRCGCARISLANYHSADSVTDIRVWASQSHPLDSPAPQGESVILSNWMSQSQSAEDATTLASTLHPPGPVTATSPVLISCQPLAWEACSCCSSWNP